jgi:hypothetical protein
MSGNDAVIYINTLHLSATIEALNKVRIIIYLVEFSNFFMRGEGVQHADGDKVVLDNNALVEHLSHLFNDRHLEK